MHTLYDELTRDALGDLAAYLVRQSRRSGDPTESSAYLVAAGAVGRAPAADAGKALRELLSCARTRVHERIYSETLGRIREIEDAGQKTAAEIPHPSVPDQKDLLQSLPTGSG